MSNTISDQLLAIQNDTNVVRAENANPGDSQLGQQSFLTLLVEQLKNQDPTNPSDSAQMAVQLAQFTQVEQLTQLNEGIGTLNETQQSTSAGLINTFAATLTGKEVKIAKDTVQFTGEPLDINFSLNSRATDVKINVVNRQGDVVARLDAGGMPSGEHGFTWDGRTNDGSMVGDGEYAIQIEAKDGEAPVQADHFIRGRIESLKYDQQGVLLKVNGEFISMGNVLEILS
jgi:flagellar basal-body rod modification protein FlgD